MIKTFTDLRFLFGLAIAHLLIFFAFDQTKVFWYILTGAMLLLIAYSILNEDIDDQLSLGRYLLYGVLSGFMVYAIFWLGNTIISLIHFTYFKNQITSLYHVYSPKVIWHYIVLILILIPGEEFFWRGFILKRLLRDNPVWPAVIISSFFYGLAQLYSGSIVLFIAAFIAGIIWGALYARKSSLPLVVISHLTFDLLLFLFFPLR